MRKHVPQALCRIPVRRLATFPNQQSALDFARLSLTPKNRLAVYPIPGGWAVSACRLERLS